MSELPQKQQSNIGTVISRFSINDVVKTKFKCDEGKVGGITPIWSITAKLEDRPDEISDYLVHVLFFENEKRSGYHQSLSQNDLILLKRASS